MALASATMLSVGGKGRGSRCLGPAFSLPEDSTFSFR
jgi:hypothetical protein